MPNLFGFKLCSHSHTNLVCVFEIKKEVAIIFKIKLNIVAYLNRRHFSAFINAH